ncbi:MAG: carboxypeptidase regulatory-like domain-containing protein [Planctomycetes bacterium]|nr:carboxypeptidase regulatory-like domain-containing protein [Planctomycetota bacterium]
MKTETFVLVAAAFVAGVGAGLVVARLAFRERPAARPELLQDPSEAKAPETAAAPRDAVASLREALAALPLLQDERGEGAITGSVRTEAGRPVAGVRVEATRERPGGGTQEPPAVDAGSLGGLEGELLELVARRRWTEATTREARTGADGAFRLEGLADAAYSVRASLEGYEIEPASGVDAGRVRPGEAIAFVAREVVRVPVQVLLPGGGEPERAAIAVTRQSAAAWRSFRRDWRPADPAVLLHPDWHELRALGGEAHELASEPVEVEVRAGEAPALVTLQLEARPGIQGRVVFPEGEEVDMVDVAAIPRASGTTADFKEFAGGGLGCAARRSEGYRYSFPDLPPGRYLLGTGRKPEGIEVVEEARVEDRMVEKDLNLPPLDPRDFVTLWVYDPDGRTLTDVGVDSGCRVSGGSSQGGGVVIRRPDGSFWVLHHARNCDARDPSLLYTVTVRSYQYGARELEYKLPQEAPLVVRFRETASLEVLVSGYAGSGHEGWIDVQLGPMTKEEGGADRSLPPHHFDRLGPRGRKRFFPLEPGEYELHVMLKSHATSGGGTGIASVRVTVRPGENRLTLPMPALGTLTVLVEGLGEDARLNLRGFDPGGGGYAGVQFNGVRPGEDGKLTFERLPSGTYELSTRSGGRSGAMRVEVPGQPVVRFEPRPHDAYRVIVRDPGGYLARAGFETGDVIVGIDGVPFESEAQMSTLMDSAAARGEVKARVVRAGRELEIRFDARMRHEHEKLGGTLWASIR